MTAATRLAFPVVAAVLAIVTATAAPASALTTTGYTPQVATSPSNLPATTGLLESLGTTDVAGTPSAPGIPDRVTDPRVGEWFDHAGDVPIKTGATSRTMWTELETLQRAVKVTPKLAQFAKIALPVAGTLGGGLFGFAAVMAGEYVIGRILTPAKPPTGPVWDLAQQGVADKGDVILGRCFICGTYTGQFDHTLVAPVKVYETVSNVNHFYFCTGGQYPGSPTVALGGIPTGAAVTMLGTETVAGGSCGGAGPGVTLTHFDVTAPLDPSEVGPKAVTPAGTRLPNAVGSNIASPTLPALRADIVAQLDTGKYPTLSQWLDHQVSPDLTPDPTTTDVGTYVIPAVQPHETYEAYKARLVAAGAVGQIVRVDLSEEQTDPAREPGEAVRTVPYTGTNTNVATKIKVYTNSDDAEPASSGGGGGTHSIDLGPLNISSACVNFPLGVPCWILSTMQAWVVTDVTAPELHVPFPYTEDGITFDFAIFDAIAPFLRGLMLAVTMVGMAKMLYGFATGSRGD